MLLKLLFYYMLSCILLLSGCSFIGPPRNQENAGKYLESIGTNKTLIKQLINRECLTDEEYQSFSMSDNESVRFMIATNPYTPVNILCRLADDKSDLVLQGILRNKRLPLLELSKKLKDSHLLKYIVGNPNLPEKNILEIYYKNKNIPIYYFAMNPKCPDEIKNIIMNSDDFLAKKILENHNKK